MGNTGIRSVRSTSSAPHHHRLVWGLALALFVATLPQTASAQFGPPPEQQVYYSNTTVLRYNPLGLITFGEFSYRHRLFEAADSAILRNNFISAGVGYALSPGFGRVGPRIEVQPLSILSLWASYQLVGWFGSFDYLTSYTDVEQAQTEGYSDTAVDLQAQNSENYAVAGSQLWLGGTLRMKVGPVALINAFRATRYDYDLREGDQVFFDIFFDTLAADESWTVSNDLTVMAVLDNVLPGVLLAGARWTHTQSFYPDDVRGLDMVGMPNTTERIPMDRIGPFFGYRVFQHDQARFNGPTVFAMLQWHVRHPYRTGQDVTQALPYILAGFSFQGDMLAPDVPEDPDELVDDPAPSGDSDTDAEPEWQEGEGEEGDATGGEDGDAAEGEGQEPEEATPSPAPSGPSDDSPEDVDEEQGGDAEGPSGNAEGASPPREAARGRAIDDAGGSSGGEGFDQGMEEEDALE